MLYRDASVPVALILFDVLKLDGEATLALPYLELRKLLESLTFRQRLPHLPPLRERRRAVPFGYPARLEGVVAKRLNEPCRPGERSWMKKKNPGWRAMRPSRERSYASGRVSVRA